MGFPNILLAESTSDSTVLDNLSINGLLAKIAHVLLSVTVLTFKIEYQAKNKHGQQSNLQSVLNFLCVSDVEFILCIGYFFCPYPNRYKAFIIPISIQSAFNIKADIFVVCISRYGVIPTFGGCFIKS